MPKHFEWTRIEISHEEDNGKYFFTFSVRGKELGRQEIDVSIFGFQNLRGLKIHTGGMGDNSETGIIRGLVVLEKE